MQKRLFAGKGERVVPRSIRRNWYVYCSNDPVNYVDLLGLKVNAPYFIIPSKSASAWSNIKKSTVGQEIIKNIDDFEENNYKVPISIKDHKFKKKNLNGHAYLDYSSEGNGDDYPIGIYITIHPDRDKENLELATVHELGHAEYALSKNWEDYSSYESELNAFTRELDYAQEKYSSMTDDDAKEAYKEIVEEHFDETLWVSLDDYNWDKRYEQQSDAFKRKFEKAVCDYTNY